MNNIDHLADGTFSKGVDVAGDQLYWTIGEPGGVIGKKPIGAGPEQTLATATIGEPVEVKADIGAGFVYWLEQETDGSSHLRKKRLP